MSMTLRMKIAQWLAPEVFDERDRHEAGAKFSRALSNDWAALAGRRADALNKIISRATPGSNSTVKAMVKIAQDALNGGSI
jgi:hypothetical protein